MTPTETTDLAKTIDAMLAQRMAQLAPAPGGPPGLAPQAVAQQPIGFTPASGFAPPVNNGFTMAPAGGQQAMPLPTELHVRVSIPLPDGREVSGHLAFPIPAQYASPGGVQALAQAIAQAWPVQAFQPRQNGWGGQQGGGGYGGQGGGGGYGGGRRFGGYGRQW